MPFKFIRATQAVAVMGIAIASVAVSAQSRIILNPVPPKPYEPVAVSVTFDKPYCLSDVYPLIGEVTY